MTGSTITKVGGVDVNLHHIPPPLVRELQKATHAGDAAAIRQAEADILANLAFKAASAGKLNAAGFHPEPLGKVAAAGDLRKR